MVLFRDATGLCPFCERVWLALEERQIPYDCVLIDALDKPRWYVELVPTTLMPAVRINGQVMWESKDILTALEDQFPDYPSLLPSEPALRKEALSAIDSVDRTKLQAAGYSFLAGGDFFHAASRDPSKLPAIKADFLAALNGMESLLTKYGGPYLMGTQFTLVDVMYISFMERLAACLPYFRGFRLRNNYAYPALSTWFAALEGRRAYQIVRSDDKTLLLHLGSLGQLVPSENPMDSVDEDAMQARREAAGKIQLNKPAIIADIIRHSGLGRHGGSPYGSTMISVNGHPPQVTLAMEQAVDYQLLRLCSYLLTGNAGPKPATPETKAVGAAALTFFCNRVAAPKDMSAAAADEFRAACLAVLFDTY